MVMPTKSTMAMRTSDNQNTSIWEMRTVSPIWGGDTPIVSPPGPVNDVSSGNTVSPISVTASVPMAK